MIDTLRINLVDCEIKRSCPITIQPGFIDFSTGKTYNDNDLFIDNSGKIVRGSKAFLNDPKFNLTIQPSVTSELNEFNKSKLKIKRFHRIAENIQPDLYDYNSEDEVKGIFIQTSLPRLINENNLKNLTIDEQKKSLNELQYKLRTYGIKTNIFNAGLSRVDTFTNLKTEFPFYNYANIFSLMELSRMKAVGYGNESYLWKNGNQQLAIYDKITEMKSKNPELKFRGNRNIMRFENRLLKKRAITTKLKFSTVNELYTNYDELKSYHKKEVTNKIFKYNFDELVTLIKNQSLFEAKYFKDKFVRSWFDHFCNHKGMETLILVFDIDDLLELIEKIDSDLKPVALRVKKSRIKKSYYESKFLANTLNVDSTINKSNVELYNELKTKFYKEVA